MTNKHSLRDRYRYTKDSLPEKIEIGPAVLDITNERYGYATALYPCGRTSDRKIKWLCICDCGQYFEASGKNLRTGNTKSCGCFHRKRIQERNKEVAGATVESMIGRRFGKLVVLEDDGFRRLPDGKQRQLYKCQCDCGNLATIDAVYLRTGETKSCGCLRSAGELEIKNLLAADGCVYEHESKIEIDGSIYYFDFKITTDEGFYYIEFDGEQHENNRFYFLFTNSKSEANRRFSEQQERDRVKNEYCFENGIPLIRIPYSKLNKIKSIDLSLEGDFVLREESE